MENKEVSAKSQTDYDYNIAFWEEVFNIFYPISSVSLRQSLPHQAYTTVHQAIPLHSIAPHYRFPMSLLNRKTIPKRLIYTIGGERGNKMTLLMGKLTRLPQVKAGGKAIERLQQKSRKSACPPYQRG
jgi:hypothetical protein